MLHYYVGTSSEVPLWFSVRRLFVALEAPGFRV